MMMASVMMMIWPTVKLAQTQILKHVGDFHVPKHRSINVLFAFLCFKQIQWSIKETCRMSVTRDNLVSYPITFASLQSNYITQNTLVRCLQGRFLRVSRLMCGNRIISQLCSNDTIF